MKNWPASHVASWPYPPQEVKLVKGDGGQLDSSRPGKSWTDQTFINSIGDNLTDHMRREGEAER